MQYAGDSALCSFAGAVPVVLSFTDLDGDGGNAPVINGGTLQANTTYTGTIDLLNEAEIEKLIVENRSFQYIIFLK